MGDLYAQLEQPEEAEKAWRRAVEKHLRRRDRIAAAKLLETKLKAPDEALAVLAAAWPASSQAGRCLAAEFALLGRLGRHEAAQRRVAEIRQERLSEAVRSAGDRRAGRQRRRLSARGGPQSGRRRHADDRRPASSRGLGPELDHLLEALRRLAPGDRLLDRDTARYLRIRTQPPRPAAKADGADGGSAAAYRVELKRLDSIALAGGVKWQCAVSCGDHFYAAGFQDRHCCCGSQGVLDGRDQCVIGGVDRNRPPCSAGMRSA